MSILTPANFSSKKIRDKLGEESERGYLEEADEQYIVLGESFGIAQADLPAIPTFSVKRALIYYVAMRVCMDRVSLTNRQTQSSDVEDQWRALYELYKKLYDDGVAALSQETILGTMGTNSPYCGETFRR